MDSLTNAESRFYSYSRNIKPLNKAGSWFKYENKMPTTSHYDRILKDIEFDNVAGKRLLSKSMKSPGQIRGIERKVIEGLDKH